MPDPRHVRSFGAGRCLRRLVSQKDRVDRCRSAEQEAISGLDPWCGLGDPGVGNLSGLPVNLGLDRTGKKVERSPAALAGTLLRDALKAHGVIVSGVVRVGWAPSGSSIKELGRVLSPPLREIIAWTNRWSIAGLRGSA